MDPVSGLGLLLSLDDEIFLEIIESGEIRDLCESVSIEISMRNDPPKLSGRC